MILCNPGFEIKLNLNWSVGCYVNQCKYWFMASSQLVKFFELLIVLLSYVLFSGVRPRILPEICEFCIINLGSFIYWFYVSSFEKLEKIVLSFLLLVFQINLINFSNKLFLIYTIYIGDFRFGAYSVQVSRR